MCIMHPLLHVHTEAAEEELHIVLGASMLSSVELNINNILIIITATQLPLTISGAMLDEVLPKQKTLLNLKDVQFEALARIVSHFW